MGKPKRSRDAAGEDVASTSAAAEAEELLATIRRDLIELEKFVASEESSIGKKGVAPKRLARLRLVCQDIHSAAKFSSRSVKS